MAPKKQTAGRGKKISIGVAVTAAALAAAGAYYLYGSRNAPQNRKKVRGWMMKAKGDVLDAVEKVKQIDQEAYFGIIDSVLKRYTATKGASKAELSHLARELRDSWKHIERAGKTGTTKRRKKSA